MFRLMISTLLMTCTCALALGGNHAQDVLELQKGALSTQRQQVPERGLQGLWAQNLQRIGENEPKPPSDAEVSGGWCDRAAHAWLNSEWEFSPESLLGMIASYPKIALLFVLCLCGFFKK